MPDVISLGEVLIDLFGRPVGVSLKEATSFIAAPGGAPANVAVALARLGVDVGFMGAVGDDPFGERLSTLLEKEGVDLTHFQKVPEAPTMIAFVAAASPEDQDFTIYRGADSKLVVGRSERSYIGSAKALIYGSVTLSGEGRNAALQAARWANEEGVLVLYDANLRPALWPGMEAAREGILEGLNGVDVCKVNEIEMELLAGTQELAEGSLRILALGPKLCLVTLGAGGAYFNSGGFRGYVPAFPIDAVDTTGCGDAFCAGLIARLFERAQSLDSLTEPDLFDMVRFANAVSACCGTRTGAMAALPRRDQVEGFLRGKFDSLNGAFASEPWEVAKGMRDEHEDT